MAAETPTPDGSAGATPPAARDLGELRTTRGGTLAGDHARRDTRLRVLAGPATQEQFNTLRAAIFPIACWRAEDMNFEFDSSFPLPDLASGMASLKEIVDAHSDATREPSARPPVTLFGHADPVGDEGYNKALSGQRARAVHALLTRDLDAWKELHADGEWGEHAERLMLETLGHATGGAADADPAKGFKEAVRAFREREGLGTGTSVDAPTRRKLHERYMDALCRDASGEPFRLAKEDFLGRGADAKGKGDYQGCGEFNPVLVFSQSEKSYFDQSGHHAERNNANAPNRRVVALLFRPGTSIDVSAWPCPRGGEGVSGCEKRLWSDADARRAPGAARREYATTGGTFGCRFYDRMSTGSPCERGIDDASGILHLRLVSEVEVNAWDAREIRLRGHGLDIRATTDDTGRFFRAPVPAGDYRLEVGSAVCRVPALPFGSEPHLVHVPYSLLPDTWGEGFFDTDPPAIAHEEGAREE